VEKGALPPNWWRHESYKEGIARWVRESNRTFSGPALAESLMSRHLEPIPGLFRGPMLMASIMAEELPAAEVAARFAGQSAVSTRVPQR